MGYTPGSGPKGLGTFTNSASTASDLNQLVTLIARMGNLRVGTTAERDAVSGDALFKGLHWYDTTLDKLMKHNGTGWVEAVNSSGWIIPTLQPGWTSVAGETVKYQIINGVLFQTGRATKTAGAATQVFVYPVGARPTGSQPVVNTPADQGTQIMVISTGGSVDIAGSNGVVRSSVSLATAFPVI